MAEDVQSQADQDWKPESTNILVLYIHTGILMYIEFINQLITGIIDGLFSLWKVLTSKEAIKIYILIGKGIFFFLVIAVTILGAIAEAQNKRKRRRY